MIKKILASLIFLLCFGQIYSQDPNMLEVNHPDSDGNYHLLPLKKLIQEKFIDAECIETTWVGSNENPEFDSSSDYENKSYGYFIRPEGVDFPFDEGIVLTSGKAYRVGNTTQGNLSDSGAGWNAGDPDLEALVSSTAISNVTSLEFEFEATVSEMSFRYIFASEEYGDGSSFPCTGFDDAFAFILSGPGVPEVNTYNHDSKPATPAISIDLGGKNIALVPNSDPPVPVAVTTLHNQTCTSGQTGFGVVNNEEYFFGNYSPINHDGGSEPLTAVMSGLQIGETYRIKLAISDDSDTAYDSAIYLEAGSFKIPNPEIDEPFISSNDNIKCYGDSYVLGGDPVEGANYQWYVYTEEIDQWSPVENAIDSEYEVFESGIYKIVATFGSSNCTKEAETVVEFVIPAEPLEPVTDKSVCSDGTTGAVFDLSDYDEEVLQTNDPNIFSVHYYLFDYQINDLALTIDDITLTPTFPSVTIWAQVKNNSEGPLTECYEVVEMSFSLVGIPEVNPVTDLVVCDVVTPTNLAGFEEFDLTVTEAELLGGLDSVDYDIKYYEDDLYTIEITNPDTYTNIVANNQTIYVKITPAGSSDSTACLVENQFEIIVNELPVVTVPANMVQCADNTIFDLTTQNDLITTETGVTITYYNAAGDEITTADAYTGANNEVITATVTNDTTTCEDSVTFELILNPLPVVTPTYSISDCDLDQDGLITWDISTQTTTLDNAGAYTVTYYSDAALTTEITNLNTYVSGAASVYYQLEDNVTGCLNSGLFNLEIGAQPVVEDLYLFEECDDLVPDGIRSFDLTSLDAQIIGSNLNTAVSYYEVLDFAPGADLPTSPAITNPSDYVSGTNTIFGYVYDVSSGCWTTTEINLVVGEIPVVNLDITHYELCDDDYDGYTLFNLSTKEAEILAPTVDPSTANIKYYNSQADAEADVDEIVAPNIVNYQNATQNVHQVWVKVSYDVSECAAYTSFYVIVHPKPLINEVNNIEMCDDGDGSVAFDLTNTQTTDEILNGQNGISITYFTDLNEANQAVIDEANGNVGSFAYIATPANFENTVTPVQTIYAVLKNDVTGCGTVTPFNIEVLPQPEFPDELQTLEVCEDDINDGITTVYLTDADAYYNASTPGFIVTYHHTEAEAFDGLNAIASPYINNATPDNFTVWVRLENNVTHCFDITTLEVIIHESPASTLPTPLEVCDDNNDGFAEFNLTLKDTEITYALGQVTVTYFEELIDAQEEIYDNAISNSTAYPNVDINNQVVYALVKNTITGCTDIVALELIVNPTPTAIVPEAIELCDDEVVDGMTTFDLTVREGEIVAETGISFEYYYTEAAAISGDVTNTAQGVGYILNPTAFVNDVNPQTVWVRAEYAATDCAKVVPLELIVNATPVLVQPTPLEFCDEDVDGDDTNGVVQGFLLYEKDAEILNGGTGEVVYHEGAIDGPVINKLVPYTNVTAGSQAVYAVVTNTETGCSSYVILDLIVNPLPAVEELEKLEACDDDYDGHAFFDLNEATEIFDPFEEYTITYHITEQNAHSGQQELADSYYSVASTIYVRVENEDTGCYIVRPLELELSEKPEIDPIEDYVLCEDEDNNGFAIFYLDTVRDGILASQPDLTISMYLSEADAEAINNPIDMDSPFLNTVADQQTIWVRVENSAGCYIIESFELIIEDIPHIGNASIPHEVCDDDFDGFASFDLTQNDTHYLAGQLGMVVTYHTSLANAEGDITDIPDFTNYVNTIINAQELYVRVENQTTGCYAISTLTLIVEPLPKVDMEPTALEVCDDDTDGTAIFDITEKEAEILSGQNPAGI
uniref:choice-of-anchor L domain-containing protein n=1 Tax=Aureivirga sp. CE67 TaxID=1788983 RepID=UPI0018CBA761